MELSNGASYLINHWSGSSGTQCCCSCWTGYCSNSVWKHQRSHHCSNCHPGWRHFWFYPSTHY